MVIYVTLNGMFGGSSLLVYFFISSSDKLNKMLILILIQYILHFIRYFGHDVVKKAHKLFSVSAVCYWFYYVKTLVQQQFHKLLCILNEFACDIQSILDYPATNNSSSIVESYANFTNTVQKYIIVNQLLAAVVHNA